MPTTVFLDVNETLLDLSALDPHFAAAFGDAQTRPKWFAELLQLALTHTVTGDYRDFLVLGEAALHALGQKLGQPVLADLPNQVRATMRQLPPHPDTRAALERLRGGGAALYALTNNPLPVVQAQLEHAGLGDLFTGVLSGDTVQTLKPGRAAYLHGLQAAGADATDSWLVAAHGWDITGARAAGLRTAFVTRPGQAQNPLAPADLSGPLAEVAGTILAG